MKDLYSESQKNLIMLHGDLLGSPLTLAEQIELREAMASAEGDLRAAEHLLSSETRTKVKSFCSKGLKLSLEIEKLNQRGIEILFPEKGNARDLDSYFACPPSLLFALGNKCLLDDEASAVSLSLTAFRAAGYTGVFIIDRSFDSLLRNDQVVAALRNNQALLVSDRAKSRANAKPTKETANAFQKQDVATLPKKHAFVSGSRSQSSIPKAVQDSLEAIIGQGIGILIGDSDKGVDNEIIDFLRIPLYRYVTIYTIAEHPRIKPEPEWATRTIEADMDLKPQQRQMVKDRAMADDADWGLALFNPIEKNRYGALQVSTGTLRNTIQMLLQGKMVKFFYVFEDEARSKNLKELKDLESVIEGYRFERLSSADERTILSSKGVSPDDDAAQVKSSKIMAKYKALLKDEMMAFEKDGEESACAVPVQGVLPLFD